MPIYNSIKDAYGKLKKAKTKTDSKRIHLV